MRVTPAGHVLPPRRPNTLQDIYQYAAKVAFGWAEQLRRRDPDALPPEDAAKYVAGMPSSAGIHRPGSPLAFLTEAFSNPSKTADEWEALGNEIVRRHDAMCSGGR